METQSQDTARMTRIEAARQAALGTLSRARETLQVAATTVPAWARGVETKAGETVDALLERVGLVRIARVEAQRPGADATATSEPPPVEAAAPVEAVAPVEASTDAAEEPAEVTAEAVTEAAAGETTDAPAEEAAHGPAATVEPAGDRSGRRRRR